MAPPVQVIQWLEANYPKPRVDPEWLSQCYDYLVDSQNHNPHTDLPALLQSLEYQLLRSDLRESMLPGTGLPPHSPHPDTITTLNGPPILVEIVALTEIAHSAFALNQIRTARAERMQAGTADNDDDDNNNNADQGEADLEVEGEGPLPTYPRGTLKLELSDGTTTLPAVERWPLPELSLEDTPMGYKMLLKDVSIHRGIAHLGPGLVVLKGHETAMREKRRPFDFTRGLYLRMGLPPPPEPDDDAEADADENAAQAPAPDPSPAVNPRSPLRDISPPPTPPPNAINHDDTDLEPRRRRIPNHNPDPPTAPAPVATASSSSTLAPMPSKPETSPYFSTVSPESWSGTTTRRLQPAHSMGLTLTPPQRATKNICLSPSLSPSPPPAQRAAARATTSDGGLLTRTVAAAVATGEKGKAREAAPGTDDEFGDDGMDVDEDFLEGLDRAEREALGPSSYSYGAGPASGSSALAVASRGGAGEVITIDDDEEDGEGEDKENRPVPTRHVRRRTEDGGSGGLGMGAQDTKGGGMPAVWGSVIELSDSD